MTDQSFNPWIGLSNFTLRFAKASWMNQKLLGKILTHNWFLFAFKPYLRGHPLCYAWRPGVSAEEGISMWRSHPSLIMLRLKWTSRRIARAPQLQLTICFANFPLMLLSSFSSSFSSGQSVLSAYLTMSDCGDLSSSSPINPQFTWASLMCWAKENDVTLTDKSDDSYHRRFIRFRHVFNRKSK